jgi:pimeloyl-ACP methyl ester carboxylesterase
VTLWHYPPTGGRRARHPVLLCPGLASNRHAFDLGSPRSLPRELAAQGFDTWVLELRGHGASWRPPWWAPWRWTWDVDTYLLHDVPAATAAVCERSGADALHWVGHSMGGILLYGQLATGAMQRLRSGTTIGSALDYSEHPSDYHAVRRLEGLLTAMPRVPLGVLAVLTAPVAARFGGSVFDRFNADLGNVEPLEFRRLQALTFHAVPAALLRQLSTAFLPGGLRDRTHSRSYLEALERAAVRHPLLALSGVTDRQCSPEASAHTAARIRGARALAFGRLHGHRADYGHYDLLMGRHAHTEVFPEILAHLEDAD